MTTIPPSLIPFFSSGVTGTSQLSSDQSLLDQLNSQQNQNSAGNMFGGAFSLNLSDAALGALGGNSGASNDSTTGILNALTYSNFFNNSQVGTGSIDALLGSLENIGSSATTVQDFSTTIDPSTTNSTAFAETTLASDGPLPAFLAQVDIQLHLNHTQQQALQNIATQNMDAADTPDTVQKIAMELQQAGI